MGQLLRRVTWGYWAETRAVALGLGPPLNVIGEIVLLGWGRAGRRESGWMANVDWNERVLK